MMISVMNKSLYSSAASVAVAAATAALGSSSGAPSETQSEISSVESNWTDIKAIALKLGVSDPDDLHTERFKVDRQKLEQLIQTEGTIEGMNGAESFFENVMKTTETYISWPYRLKVGAKSKKDPHVRIVGKINEVAKAKSHILAALDSKGVRVIMKMDVSYTDHSYIIGRGGNNIKRIMEETSTHIHFPDSNRSNPSEKSNQVSLCGTLQGVEKARALLRLSTPLLISFELIVLPMAAQPDRDNPCVTMVEQKYNVQIIFSSRPKLHSSLVLVKGSERDSVQVKEATQTLINFYCGNLSSKINVHMQMEISPQHHEVVKGKNSTNLLQIMEQTKTKVIFPDLNDLNIKPLKKSQVTINGTIDGVYLARQKLLGYLPVTLIFDFPFNESEANSILGLSSKYGVHIGLRQKQRQSTLAIVVKGLEKFIDKIYETRHEILRQNTPIQKAEVPETYFMPQDHNLSKEYLAQLANMLEDQGDRVGLRNQMAALTLHNADILLNNGSNKNNNNINNNNNNYINNNLKNAINYNLEGKHAIFQQVTPTSVCPPTQKYLQMHNNSLAQQQQLQMQQSVQNNNNYLQIISTQQQQQQQHQSQQRQQQANHQQQQHNVSPRNSCCNNTSGYQSFSSSTTSLEQACPPFITPTCFSTTTNNNNNKTNINNNLNNGGTLNNHNGAMQLLNSNRNSLPFSAESFYGTDTSYGRIGRRSSDGVLLGIGASASGEAGVMGTNGNTFVPSVYDNYRGLRYDIKNRPFDMDMKRLLGFKAMEKSPVPGEVRTPNSQWVGLGLSRTSPAPIETVDDLTALWPRSALANNLTGGGSALVSPYGLGATTGLIDSTPINRRMQITQHSDIQTLLVSLGLEHYIKMFVLNEIDLELFTMLTEENLMELGVTAFGARKKLLAAIHLLQANDMANSLSMTSNLSNNTSSSNSNNASSNGSNTSARFSGSAAPGAERRPSNQW